MNVRMKPPVSLCYNAVLFCKSFGIFNDQDIFPVPVEGIMHLLEPRPAIMIAMNTVEGGIGNSQYVTISINIQVNIFASCIISWLHTMEFIIFLKPLYFIQVTNRYQVPTLRLMNAKTIIKNRSLIDNFFHDGVRGRYHQKGQSNNNKKKGDYFSHRLKLEIDKLILVKHTQHITGNY